MALKGTSRLRALLALVLALAAALTLAACGGSNDDDAAATTASGEGTETTASGGDAGLDPINSGRLTVGMNLQFKPQMYLDNGEPAGYDVELLKQLAPDAGLELDIQNLDFNGLIPGLQGHKFDLVSVGLAPTEERRKVVDFSRAYVPYAQVIGAAPDRAAAITSPDDLNQAGKRIVALQGSTAEQLARRMFPKATVNGLPDQNAAFLEAATGRADAIIVEDYLLAQFDASNRGQIEIAGDGRPLDVQYGSYAVPKGNDEFVAFLDDWLCEKQQDGTLEELYKSAFGVDAMPPMPDDC